MSSTSDRRPRSHTYGSDGHQQRPNARTLRLFTVSDTADSATADVAEAADEALQESKSHKNPRWLASREKEAKGEAIRDKIIRLIDDIEAEEALDRPALKKAWLREKKLELRRISFRQPDEIIAREDYFRRARRKLREARRSRRQDEDGDAEGESDAGDSGGEEGDDDDTVERNSESARETFTSAQDGSDSDDASTSTGGVFNLNPSGRIARPNPRAKPLPEIQSPQQPPEEAKWRKHLHRMGKVVRLPLESGYKLGRFIRSHRDKAQQRGGSGDGNSPTAGDGEDDWGRRVDWKSAADGDNHRRLSDASSNGDPIRIVVDSGSGAGDAGASSHGGGGGGGDGGSSSSSSSVADIPVLQESVGKKLRDRLTIRRSPRQTRRRRSPVGSSSGGGAEDADDIEGGSGGSGSVNGEKARKDKKHKEKLAKKDKMGKKATKEKSGDDSEDEKQKKKKAKKGKEEKKKAEKDGSQTTSGAGSSRVQGGVRAEQLPVEFVELEDDIQ